MRSTASSYAAMHMVAGSRPVFVIAWEWHIGLALLCGCSGALEYPTTNSYRPINKSLSLSLSLSYHLQTPPYHKWTLSSLTNNISPLTNHLLTTHKPSLHHSQINHCISIHKPSPHHWQTNHLLITQKQSISSPLASHLITHSLSPYHSWTIFSSVTNKPSSHQSQTNHLTTHKETISSPLTNIPYSHRTQTIHKQIISFPKDKHLLTTHKQIHYVLTSNKP